MRAVIVMRRAVIIMLLLLRLMRLTSALRLAGRRAVHGIERLMTAALVRPMIPVQLRLGQTTVRTKRVRVENRYRQLARAVSLLLAIGFARGDIAGCRIVTAL